MADGTIYAICAGNAIKIGYTKNSVEARMAEIQVGNAKILAIAATIDGNLNGERLIQEYLRSDNIRGEWFYPTCNTMRVLRLMVDHTNIESVLEHLESWQKFPRAEEEHGVCAECGTNLSARAKERKRRREYMREYRKDDN